MGFMDYFIEIWVIWKLKVYGKGRLLLILIYRMLIFNLVDWILVIDSGKVVVDGFCDSVVEVFWEGCIGKVLWWRMIMKVGVIFEF